MNEPSQDRLTSVFRDHGVRGQVKEVLPREADEAIFVLTVEDAAQVDERKLALALQELLDRKVWVVPASSSWDAQAQPL